MNKDRPLLGILLMLGFCVLAPMGDAIAKLLGSAVSLILLLVVRFLLQALILIPIVIWHGDTLRQSPRIMRLTFYRTVFHILGIGAMYLSLRFLPLADAVAIAFVMPFIMLLLGKYVLGEEVGHRRIGACLVGFAGTLMVIQPSFATVGLPALLPLVVAFTFALFMLVTRQMAKEINPLAMQSVSGIMALPILLLPVLLLPDHPEFSFKIPDQIAVGQLIALGVIGTAAHLLMTWSLKFAPSATLAPMQYLEIPIATAIGFLVFSDIPNGLAAVGIVVTISAGLAIIYFERQNAKIAAAAS